MLTGSSHLHYQMRTKSGREVEEVQTDLHAFLTAVFNGMRGISSDACQKFTTKCSRQCWADSLVDWHSSELRSPWTTGSNAPPSVTLLMRDRRTLMLLWNIIPTRMCHCNPCTLMSSTLTSACRCLHHNFSGRCIKTSQNPGASTVNNSCPQDVGSMCITVTVPQSSPSRRCHEAVPRWLQLIDG